jgi:hypothetical protein
MSDKPDPITNFLNAHKKPLTKDEEFKLKDRLRHRKSYAKKTQLPWKDGEDAKDMHTGPRDAI